MFWSKMVQLTQRSWLELIRHVTLALSSFDVPPHPVLAGLYEYCGHKADAFPFVLHVLQAYLRLLFGPKHLSVS